MISKIILGEVDARILRACSAPSEFDSLVRKAIEHHFNAGGSRVRAHFSLEASSKLGVEHADAITLAAICEILHNASLIHDDLIDRAPLRRGLASVWSKFGDSTALCAGDLLLSTAFSLVADLHRLERLPQLLRLVHQRTRDVILGQDAEQTSCPQNLQEFEKIAIGKSASLLSLPFELSLLVSGNEHFLELAAYAATSFATAYQILDDLSDYFEDKQNGSLNAVSVAMGTTVTHSVAVALVQDRANAHIATCVEDASHLPMESGASMIAYARIMQQKLSAIRDEATSNTESLHYGG